MKGILKRTFSIAAYFYNRFMNDGCPLHAAALSYTTLLSLVPLLIVIFWVLSYFPIFQGTGEFIQRFIVDNLAADSATAVSQHIKVFLSSMQRVSYFGVITFGFGTILMMYNLVQSFDEIWHVRAHRHFAITFVIYFLILFLSPIAIGILFLISTFLTSLPFISNAKDLLFFNELFIKLLPFFSAFTLFTFFNWALPSTKVRFLSAVIAGLITTLLFEVARYFFALYLAYFPTYRVIYGALAAIPIFLVWMYLVWSIILFGAIVCHTLNHKGWKNLS